MNADKELTDSIVKEMAVTTDMLFPMVVALFMSLLFELNKNHTLNENQTLDIFDNVLVGLSKNDLRVGFIEGLRSVVLKQSYDEYMLRMTPI